MLVLYPTSRACTMPHQSLAFLVLKSRPVSRSSASLSVTSPLLRMLSRDLVSRHRSLLCSIVLLDLVHRLTYNITLNKFVLLTSSGKKGRGRAFWAPRLCWYRFETSSTRRQNRLVSLLFFFTDNGSRTEFRNVIILLQFQMPQNSSTQCSALSSEAFKLRWSIYVYYLKARRQVAVPS
jgi:hypothetical protein